MPCTEWIPTKQTGSICRQHELPSTEQNNTEQDITKQNTIAKMKTVKLNYIKIKNFVH